MGLRSTHIYFLVISAALPIFINGEIHRARGRKFSTLSVRPSWPPGPDRVGPPPSLEDSQHPDDPEPIFKEPAPPQQEKYLEFGQAVIPPTSDHDECVYTSEVEHVVEKHTSQQWLLSILSAMLVGLSGIFPLLVIPLESGEALRHGAPAARLKLLLSFAVGGLLGDVFLHLLPEAWAHLPVGDHEGHMWVGMWVILGLMAFLLVEKLFPDGEAEEEGEEEEAEETEKETQLTTDAELMNNKEMNHLKEKFSTNGYIKHRSNISNGHSNGHLSNGHSNGHLSNGHVSNGHSNGHVSNGHATEQPLKKLNSKPASSHIKTSGWLNLLANVVDNFTHGLAVAGSYCVSTKVGLLTTLAVLLHEVPHEVGDFAILLRSGFDRWQAAKAQLLTATGGLFGALCALLADSAQAAGDTTAWVLPFTSGGFIYIALVSVVPDLLKETNPRESLKQVVLLCLGIAVMLLVTVLFE